MKVLKVFFMVLIVLTFVELGYYFIVVSNNKSGITDNQKKTVENKTDNAAKDKVKQELQVVESAGEQLLTPEIIEELKKIRRNQGHKLTIIQEITGRLADITFHEDGKMVVLIINDRNGKTIDVTSIRTDDKNIFRITGSDKIQIKVSDLKIGDNVNHFSEMMVSEGKSNYRFEIYE